MNLTTRIRARALVVATVSAVRVRLHMLNYKARSIRRGLSFPPERVKRIFQLQQRARALNARLDLARGIAEAVRPGDDEFFLKLPAAQPFLDAWRSIPQLAETLVNIPLGAVAPALTQSPEAVAMRAEIHRKARNKRKAGRRRVDAWDKAHRPEAA